MRCEWCGAIESLINNVKLVKHHIQYEHYEFIPTSNKAEHFEDITVMICKKCHFLFHKFGIKICGECKKRYHKIRYPMCYECYIQSEIELNKTIEIGLPCGKRGVVSKLGYELMGWFEYCHDSGCFYDSNCCCKFMIEKQEEEEMRRAGRNACRGG